MIENENQSVRCHVRIQTDSPKRVKWEETIGSRLLETGRHVKFAKTVWDIRSGLMRY
jgi:hypothetical protein